MIKKNKNSIYYRNKNKLICITDVFTEKQLIYLFNKTDMYTKIKNTHYFNYIDPYEKYYKYKIDDIRKNVIIKYMFRKYLTKINNITNLVYNHIIN